MANTPRRTQTIDLSGNAYAKVAERLKLFREDWPHSKIETEHKYNEDGTVEFKAWVWKEKSEYMDALKELKDIKLARGTADSDGNSKGTLGDKKAFEKLQTIALGRALANLGYLASGEIASFEEMEAYQDFKAQQQSEEITEAIERIKAAKDNDELNTVIQSISSVLKYQDVIDAGKAKRAELAEASQEPPKLPEKTTRPSGGKKVEEPAEEPTLPLEGDSATN